jgi:hypothetical protein
MSVQLARSLERSHPIVQPADLPPQSATIKSCLDLHHKTADATSEAVDTRLDIDAEGRRGSADHCSAKANSAEASGVLNTFSTVRDTLAVDNIGNAGARAQHSDLRKTLGANLSMALVWLDQICISNDS